MILESSAHVWSQVKDGADLRHVGLVRFEIRLNTQRVTTNHSE